MNLWCSMNLALPGLALANQLYVAVKAQGHGRLGTQSLMLGLEHLNGTIELRKSLWRALLSRNDTHMLLLFFYVGLRHLP